MLAIRSKAPVIPMVILGAHEALAGRRQLPRRVRITVRIGAPLTFDYPVSNSETITAPASKFTERWRRCIRARRRWRKLLCRR